MTDAHDFDARRIALGRSADIFALPNGRVLKLFFTGTDLAEINQEARNAARAFELGATPIACHGPMTINDRGGLVFDALSGASITELCERAPTRLSQYSRALANTHARLHSLSGDGFPEIHERLAALLATPPLAFLNAQQRRAVEKRLAQLPAGEALLHMDYHSSNVFEHEGAHAVIDWATALRGPPAADVAATLFLYREAELWPGTPWLKKRFFAIARRIARSGYIGEHHRCSGASEEEIAAWRLPILIHRLVVWDIPSERASLGRKINALTKAGA